MEFDTTIGAAALCFLRLASQTTVAALLRPLLLLWLETWFRPVSSSSTTGFQPASLPNRAGGDDVHSRGSSGGARPDTP
ncbi:unnamed protein product [Linum trigynum]|uniref:Secreted protein n=1 Tax=Linum trigynum TaxID=586398 RepID=A0AAV2GF28_9ROSI